MENKEPRHKIGGLWRSKGTGEIYHYKKYEPNTRGNLHHVLVQYFSDHDHETFKCTRWCSEKQLLEEFEPCGHDYDPRERFLEFAEGIKKLFPITETKTFTGLAERYGWGESKVQNMHNDHYAKLGDYEPFKVFEAFVNGNDSLFRDNPSLSGYYLQAIKYLGRVNSKDTPVQNLEKAIVYIQEMLKIIERT